MLLRVVDIPGSQGYEDRLQIMLEENGTTHEFSTKNFHTPFTANFFALLNWYFKGYLLSPKSQQDDRQVSQKLIARGQYLGDELLGEDLELLKFIQIIEDSKYSNLDVRIESDRPEFFNYLWETMVFEKSKYVLAGAVKSFVRQFSGSENWAEATEINYALEVNPPARNMLIGMVDQSPGEKASIDTPLRVLHLVPPSEAINSNALSLSMELASGFGKAIYHEIVQINSWKKLEARLNDTNSPVHILHFEGQLKTEKEKPHFSLSDNPEHGKVFIDALCQCLKKNKVSSLFLDLRQSDDESQDKLNAAKDLASIAQIASKAGVGNVVGLSFYTDPWTSAQCFFEIYRQIVRGFTLGQAVVEARKALQASMQNEIFSFQPVGFQAWPLLTHYGSQTVYFFRKPQSNDDGMPNELAEIVRKKLFGFLSEYLPPLIHQVGNQFPLAAIEIIDDKPLGCAVKIEGGAGSGKTQLAHLANIYLAKSNKIDYGFYFNFVDADYSCKDMLQMIAPILGLSDSENEACKTALKKLRCCLVLDHLEKSEQLHEVTVFLDDLVNAGHYIIIISNEESLYPIEPKLTVKRLTEIQELVFTVEVLRKTPSLTAGEHSEVVADANVLEPIIRQLNGNPWLIKKVIPLIASNSLENLKTQIDSHISARDEGEIDQLFYAWQWSCMPEVYKSLLRLCAQNKGLILEMLIAAAEQKELFEPAARLFEALGDSEAGFSQAVRIWEESGFVARFPHGRTIDSRAREFVSRSERGAGLDEEAKAQLYFSQVVCEGVRILSSHVMKQPYPYITNNLLFNRRQWVKHFERLWFNQDYEGFVRVKGSLDQLLRQAKLDNESFAWSLDLLNRSPVFGCSDEFCTNAKLAWLNLAIYSLNVPDAHSQKNIESGARNWSAWCETLTDFSHQDQLVLFQQAANFVEKYYQQKNDWTSCIKLSEKCRSLYKKASIWHKLVETLKKLIDYHIAISNMVPIEEYERSMLVDIPYEEAPPGYKAQQMMDILYMRLKRSEIEGAQEMLDEIKAMEHSFDMAEVLGGAQSEIHYRNKDYRSALPFYLKFLTRVNQQQNEAQKQQIQRRLSEIEEEIGREDFKRICDNCAAQQNLIDDFTEKPEPTEVH